jgi:hypothetical protein
VDAALSALYGLGVNSNTQTTIPMPSWWNARAGLLEKVDAVNTTESRVAVWGFANQSLEIKNRTEEMITCSNWVTTSDIFLAPLHSL